MADQIQAILNDEEKFTEVCRAAFDEVDTDKSGEIERAEFAVALENLAKDLDMEAPTEERIDEVLATLDTDKSGALSFAEFKEFVRQILSTLASA